ncbi:MAG: hypothetical protein AAF564_25050 [Bacteroidota bacterium]
MNRPLRKRHKVMIILVSIVVPLLFAAAIMIRQPTLPTNDNIPVQSPTP